MEEIIKKRYRILRPIGSGGMSEVFLAHDEVLDRDVAVKRLRDQFSGDKELLDQFKREAKSAAQLVHPNIIGIYDVVEDGGDQYIVMEYVEGTTLKDILKDYRIEPKAALQITRQLAGALQQAHSRNIIHCDIKPQNILMSDNMIPKIADFGIAKMVSGQTMVFTGNVMGSVHYISPEQAGGDQVTFASDIYSLGIVLYEMLTGQVPFHGETPVSVAMMQVEKAMPKLGESMENVPQGVQSILDKMTAKKPENRYLSAGQLCEDLDSVLRDENISTEEQPEGMDGSTIIMEPVKPGGKRKIIALSVDKDAMAEKAKDWQEALRYQLKNFYWTFNRAVIALTLAVCFVSACAFVYFRFDNAMVLVPQLVNMQVTQAETRLKNQDFLVELQQETSLTVPAGTVIRQMPEAGSKRRKGSAVKLFFSVGAEQRTMPDLIGMSLIKGQQTLDEIGMKLGKVERRYNNGYKIGAIIEQDPRAGEKTNEGALVNIVLNEGTKKLPELIGKSLSEAETIVRQLGLRVGEIRRVNSPERKGMVTATFPEAGTMLPNYYPVQLTISDGTDKSVVGAVFEYVVPGPATEKHRVQIYEITSKGRNLIYNSVDNGGKYIRQTVDGDGKRLTVVVYCDGKQVREDTF